MTFYQELKEFFLKHDRDRLYMAKAIASKFNKKSQHKVVLKRLEIIYKNGGPANIEIEEKQETPELIEEEVNVVSEVEAPETTEVEEENEPQAQDIVIETEDDEKKGDA